MGSRSTVRRSGDKHVAHVVKQLIAALEPDDIVLGGGNAKLLKKMPKGCRAGDNANAFLGGFRLWTQASAPAHRPAAANARPQPSAAENHSMTSAAAVLKAHDDLLSDPAALRLAAGDLDAIFLPTRGMLGASLRHRGEELLRRVEDLGRRRARGAKHRRDSAVASLGQPPRRARYMRPPGAR